MLQGTHLRQQFTIDISTCVSLNTCINNLQKAVVDGAVFGFLDACRLETGLAAASVEGYEGGR
jgi:hypothetical protein